MGRREVGRTSAFWTRIRGTATYRPREQSPMISCEGRWMGRGVSERSEVNGLRERRELSSAGRSRPERRTISCAEGKRRYKDDVSQMHHLSVRVSSCCCPLQACERSSSRPVELNTLPVIRPRPLHQLVPTFHSPSWLRHPCLTLPVPSDPLEPPNPPPTRLTRSTYLDQPDSIAEVRRETRHRRDPFAVQLRVQPFAERPDSRLSQCQSQ